MLLRLLPRPGGGGGDGDGSSSPPKSTFARDALLAVRAVESLLQDLSSGTLTPPKHVYRIIPLASTCRHDKESLENCARRSSSVASTLIQQHKDIPLTFGVAVHSRDQQSDKDSTFLSGRRGDVINAVATGLTQGLVECHGIKELKVDLKDPSIVVSVEMLPIMGHVYAGLSLLPRSVCSTKPKLAVKSLR